MKYSNNQKLNFKMLGEEGSEEQGQEEQAIDTNSEAFKKAMQPIVQSFEEKINSLVSHKDTVLSEKRELENKLKGLKDQTNNNKDETNNDIVKVKEDFTNILKDKDSVISGWEEKYNTLETTIKTQNIKQALQSKISTVETLQKSAINDAVDFASKVFNHVDDKGNAVVLEANGLIKHNTSGANYSVDDYVNDLQETRSYLFNQKQGSDYSNSPKAGKQTISRTAWNEIIATGGDVALQHKRDYTSGQLKIVN
jgi:hypothetical protein